jgi:hypothetical protein
VFQTMGVPPRIGKTVRATTGSIANISSELRNSDVAKSQTMLLPFRLARSILLVNSIVGVSRQGVKSSGRAPTVERRCKVCIANKRAKDMQEGRSIHQ